MLVLTNLVALVVVIAFSTCFVSSRRHGTWPATSTPLSIRRDNSSYLETLSENQRKLFEFAMSALDVNFAPPFLVSGCFYRLICQENSPQFNSPRYSAWYAVGLLARNEDDDAAIASQIIQEVSVASHEFQELTSLLIPDNRISSQYTDPSRLWFGTYRKTPNVPDPGPVFTPDVVFYLGLS